MQSTVKTNRLAVVSMISGLVIPLSLGLYWVLFRLAYQTSPGYSPGADNPIMDLSVSLRQICAPVALLTGFLALRQIKKNAEIEKGKIPAWIGIILGAGWLLFGLLVGMVFLVGNIPH